MSSFAPKQQTPANLNQNLGRQDEKINMLSERESVSERYDEFGEEQSLATTQRRLQNSADGSLKIKQLRVLQRMLRHNDRANQFESLKSTNSVLTLKKVEQDNSTATRNIRSLQSSVQKMIGCTPELQRKAKLNLQSSTAVIQRLMNPAPVIGSATSYHVSAADLGNGTGTTAPVRLWAQANAPGQNPINFRYATSNAAGTVVGAWNGPFAAPNPAPAGGANWHAGHILARQNGGPGHIAAANWIIPQNPQVNMGHGGTYGLWRAHEVAFHNLVGAAGHGVWDVW